jgi:hypothetical protein
MTASDSLLIWCVTDTSTSREKASTDEPITMSNQGVEITSDSLSNKQLVTPPSSQPILSSPPKSQSSLSSSSSMPSTSTDDSQIQHRLECILAVVKDACRQCRFNKILSHILPVITRWTAHYLSLSRLLAVEVPMKASWMKYGQQMIDCAGPKADVQEKVHEIQAIVKDPQFWKWVKKYVFTVRSQITVAMLMLIISKGPAAISNPL